MNILVNQLDTVFQNHFPDYLPHYQGKKPDMERLVATYSTVGNAVGEIVYDQPVPPDKHTCIEALFTSVAIRYADDFIDKVLYHAAESLNRNHFHAMLDDWMAVVRSYDWCAPDWIPMLPRVEFELLWHPTQQNWDALFQDLFRYKAIDMLYIYHRKTGATSFVYDDTIVNKVGLYEYVLDFTHEEIEDPDGFNMYRFLQENQIDPSSLIQFMETIYGFSAPMKFAFDEMYHTALSMCRSLPLL